jgi:membrane protein implicated in regulation of membrane protease activity
MNLITQLEPWHWMALGILLLVVEVVISTELLLGVGLGALVTALLYKVFPDLTWQAQFIWFSVFSIVCTLVYWKKFRSSNSDSDQPLLNQRAQQLVGKTTRLVEPIIDGEGRVQVADALWVVQGADMDNDTAVKIIGVNGMALLVEAA